MTVDAIIAAVLEQEGSEFTNDPDDPGGPTRYGITAEVLGEARQLGRMATAEEVRALTVEEASEIYRQRYIYAPRFQLLPDDQLKMFMVDCGVNHGRARATRMLQHAVGTAEDGVLGPVTLSATLCSDPQRLLAALVRARVELIVTWMQAIPARRKFLGLYRRAVSFLPQEAK